MYKLIVFDLDGTLAKLSKGITSQDIRLLHRLEEEGIQLAVCSGKPLFYLCGMFRQVSLEKPILMGENGSVVQFGIDLPPKNYFVQPYSEAAKETIERLSKGIRDRLPNIWCQPNEVGLTPFPKTEEEFDIIQNYLDESASWIKDVHIYRHIDCFDVLPCNVNKQNGIRYLGELLNVKPEEMIAIGDGVNDYPMFEYVGYSIGINVAKPEAVDMNFNSLTEALTYVIRRL